MSRFTETYPVLEETPDIVLFSGGGGGEAVAPDLIDQVGDRTVVLITGTADSGSMTGRLREVVAGYDDDGNMIPLPAVGDMRRIMSAVSGSEAGGIFETRLGDDATPDTVRGMLKEMRSMITVGTTPADVDTIRSLEGTGELAEMIQLTDGSLRGHVIGNLVLAQLFIDNKGDLGTAAAIANRWLDTKAPVIPVSNDPHHLNLRDGDREEDTVYHTEGIIDDIELQKPHTAQVWVTPVGEVDSVHVYDPAREAIEGAQVTALLPGSFFTTHGAMLSVPGVSDALNVSGEKGGRFASVANLMVDRDTRGFELQDYLDGLGRLAGREIDLVIVNSDTEGFPEGKVPLKYDENAGSGIPARVIATELLDNDAEIEVNSYDPIAHLRSTVRTSGRKVAEALVSVVDPANVAA